MFENLKRKWFGDNEGPSSKLSNDKDGNKDGLSEEMDSSSSSSKLLMSSLKSTGTQVDLKNDETELNLLKAELTGLHDAVVSNISCFKCERLPRSLPITSCANHHRLCDSCTALNNGGQQANQCTSCSSPLTVESSLLLAALLETVRRPCQWSSAGCEYSSTSLQDVDLHETVCWFQPVLCWGCNRSTPLNHFDRHSPNLLCLSHRRVNYEQAEGEMLLRQEDEQCDVDWKPVGIKFCGKMFYLRISRRRQLGFWSFHVAGQLLPHSCGRYLARIKVSRPSAEQPSRSCLGPPSSLVTGLDQVVKGGGALVIPGPDMLKLMDPNMEGSLFRFSVEMGLVQES